MTSLIGLSFIEVATHIQFSAEATANPQSLMSRFIAQGKAVVICTDGQADASLMTADGVRLQQAAVPGLHMVDSDGAGDAFFVGYLYRLANQATASDVSANGHDLRRIHGDRKGLGLPRP